MPCNEKWSLWCSYRLEMPIRQPRRNRTWRDGSWCVRYGTQYQNKVTPLSEKKRRYRFSKRLEKILPWANLSEGTKVRTIPYHTLWEATQTFAPGSADAAEIILAPPLFCGPSPSAQRDMYMCMVKVDRNDLIAACAVRQIQRFGGGEGGAREGPLPQLS